MLFDSPVEVVGEAAGLAEFVLEARDAVVEAVDVGADLVVVVDDCLDGGGGGLQRGRAWSWGWRWSWCVLLVGVGGEVISFANR